MPKPIHDHTLGSSLYEIQSILKKRSTKKGTFYLIKWRGFPESQATWQKQEGLGNIADLVDAFQNKKNGNKVNLKKDQPNMNSAQTPDFMAVDDFKSLYPIVKEESPERVNKYTDYFSPLLVNEQETEINDPSKKGEMNEGMSNESNQRKGNNQFKEKDPLNNSVDISFQTKLIAKKFDNIVKKCDMPLMSPLPKKKQKEMKQEIKGQKQTRGKKNPKSNVKTAKNSQALIEETSSNIFQAPVFDQYLEQRGKSAKSIQKSAKSVNQVQKICSQIQTQSQNKIDNEAKKHEDLLIHFEQETNEIGGKIRASYKSSKLVQQQRNKGEIKEIRMIPRTTVKPSEFLVEYGSGQLKVFQIIDLMIAHPLELVKFLEEGKSGYFC